MRRYPIKCQMCSFLRKIRICRNTGPSFPQSNSQLNWVGLLPQSPPLLIVPLTSTLVALYEHCLLCCFLKLAKALLCTHVSIKSWKIKDRLGTFSFVWRLLCLYYLYGLHFNPWLNSPMFTRVIGAMKVNKERFVVEWGWAGRGFNSKKYLVILDTA